MRDMKNSPRRGVLLRNPALQEVTRSRMGIPASAKAKVAALMHADLVPADNIWLNGHKFSIIEYGNLLSTR
jgi:hypothetical protein